MTWDEVCDDPSLQNLPYKIETNKFGQIIMSPHKRRHSLYQEVVNDALKVAMARGHTLHEAAIQTRDGVKSADVVWVSTELLRDEEARGTEIFEIAPEICVEVMSKSNPLAEMRGKMRLYFEVGAKEVWLCDQKGRMHFYSPTGPMEKSVLCPNFPLQVNLP